MGMAFNNKIPGLNNGFGLDQPPVLSMDTRIPPPKLGFDDPGGTGEKLRRLAAHLMIAGGNQQGGSSLLGELQQQQEADAQNSYRQQQLGQQFQIAQMGQNAPTPIQRNAASAGLVPGTPEWNDFILNGGQGKDEFSRLLAQGNYSPQDQERLRRQRAESLANPLDWVESRGPNGTKTLTPVPRFATGGVPSAPAGPPPQAIEFLRAHPDTSSQFDVKFGPGAAAKVLSNSASLGGAGSGLRTFS